MDKDTDYNKPVAYDTQGRPLYLRPEKQPPQSPQKVEIVKNPDSQPLVVSEDIKRRHEESKKKYPFLNLSQGEYIVSAVKRHPLGLISIWAAVVVVIMVILLVPMTFQPGMMGFNPKTAMFGTAIVLALIVLTALVGAVATMVYQGNKFFLTNESVIQFIQTSLFSRNDQVVNLGNIEDASFTQRGILQMLFGYGSIRLSTQGDETTYRFNWVINPKTQIDLLNNAIEAFKNGRPIGH